MERAAEMNARAARGRSLGAAGAVRSREDHAMAKTDACSGCGCPGIKCDTPDGLVERDGALEPHPRLEDAMLVLCSDYAGRLVCSACAEGLRVRSDPPWHYARRVAAAEAFGLLDAHMRDRAGRNLHTILLRWGGGADHGVDAAAALCNHLLEQGAT